MFTKSRTLIVSDPLTFFFLPRTCVHDGPATCGPSTPMLDLIQLRHKRRLAGIQKEDMSRPKGEDAFCYPAMEKATSTELPFMSGEKGFSPTAIL